MVQATTPTFRLRLPVTIDLSEAENVYFTLSQDNYRAITKTGNDVIVEGNMVYVYLTQADTLKFRPNVDAKLQLNWTYSGGRRACSVVVTIPVDENLLKEVVS